MDWFRLIYQIESAGDVAARIVETAKNDLATLKDTVMEKGRQVRPNQYIIHMHTHFTLYKNEWSKFVTLVLNRLVFL